MHCLSVSFALNEISYFARPKAASHCFRSLSATWLVERLTDGKFGRFSHVSPRFRARSLLRAVALVKAIRAELHCKFPFGCKADVSYALASRNLEIDNPRLVTGGFIFCVPNTQVAAFSRLIISNAATQNASAIPATRSIDAMLGLQRDVTDCVVLFHHDRARHSTRKKAPQESRLRH